MKILRWLFLIITFPAWILFWLWPSLASMAIFNLSAADIFSTEPISEPICLEWQKIPDGKGKFLNNCLRQVDLEYAKYYYQSTELFKFAPYLTDHRAYVDGDTVVFSALPQWSYGLDGNIYTLKSATSSWSQLNNLTRLDNPFGITEIMAATSTYTASSTYTPACEGDATILIVGGGGGGGGADNAGGGGGGGVTTTVQHLTVQSYNVVVGLGGAGGAVGTRGTAGQSSTFNGITMSGGGGGGSRTGGAPEQNDGGNGASGGGAGGINNARGGTGIVGQGYGGGNSDHNIIAGGGGGASEVGQSSSASKSGDGGKGVTSTISGTAVCYGGGGGGGGNSGAAQDYGRATCGGGRGGITSGGSALSGSANSGGGGGGAPDAGTSGNGGSGVVIISFDSSQCDGGSPGVSTTPATTTALLLAFTNRFQNLLIWSGGSLLFLAVLYVLYSIGMAVYNAAKRML